MCQLQDRDPRVVPPFARQKKDSDSFSLFPIPATGITYQTHSFMLALAINPPGRRTIGLGFFSEAKRATSATGSPVANYGVDFLRRLSVFGGSKDCISAGIVAGMLICSLNWGWSFLARMLQRFWRERVESRSNKKIYLDELIIRAFLEF